MGIIALFICTVITPSVAVDNIEQCAMSISNGKTLYVGGTGEGNYTSIQDAVDNASDGDTIFVYDESSPYYEHLVVDKTINLIGEDKDTTIIDGGGIRTKDVVNIFADRVNISGFTLQNSGERPNDLGIEIHSNNNIIKNNIIWNNGAGIQLNSDYFNRSKFNTISDNTIRDNIYRGIYLEEYSNNNIITFNNISNSIECILLGHASNNSITFNEISNNQHDWGIFLYKSNRNTIAYNKIMNNVIGIELIKRSRFNVIKNNIISYNNYGIIIIGSPLPYFPWLFFIDYMYDSSNQNTIVKNNFLNNKRDAFFQNSRINRWKQNYWNESLTSPKKIYGELMLEIHLEGQYTDIIHIPWFPQFDWRPAKEPYDIEGVI